MSEHPATSDGKVLLLTSPGLPQRLLAQRLHREIGLDGLVVERRRAPLGGKAAALKRSASRVLGRALFDRLLSIKHRLGEPRMERRVRRLEEDLQRAAEQRLLAEHGPDPASWPPVDILETPRVNNGDAVAWCRRRRPDLILVYGTSILKQPMIRLPRLGVLNAHSSILPHFRGVFSEFWQVLQGDFDHVGVTVHCIDPGVDTGDVVLQARSPVDGENVDPYTLRCRNAATTLEIYPRAARAVLSGEETRQAQAASPAPTYRSRDLTFERRLELWRRLGHDL